MKTVLVLAALLCAADLNGQEWKQHATYDAAGFSSDQLSAAHAYADSVRSAAVMVVHRGLVVAAWGDVARPLELHSVRKSLMAALYGSAVAEKKIDLNATLESLGIDDQAHPLTSSEKRAQVRDIIAARSGVYLPAAYAASDQDAGRPTRGSHAPGTHWFYNNWDFNVAGVVYEKATGENIYESFDRRIARPIGMEDYVAADGFRVFEPSSSQHPAMTFRMSTRDLARFGQLVLNDGMWQGRRVLPAGWVREMLTSRSDLGDAQGYGYMWWHYGIGSLSPKSYPVLSQHVIHQGRGTGGQVLFIVPTLDLVIVHRGDTDNGRNVAGRDVWRIAEMIASARQTPADVAARPALGALSALPFKSQLPAVPRASYLALPAAKLREYTGTYDLGTITARVFEQDGRLFGNLSGVGEAELFGVSADSFTIRVQSGVTMNFERDASGAVSAVVLTMGDRPMRGPRARQ